MNWLIQSVGKTPVEYLIYPADTPSKIDYTTSKDKATVWKSRGAANIFYGVILNSSTDFEVAPETPFVHFQSVDPRHCGEIARAIMVSERDDEVTCLTCRGNMLEEPKLVVDNVK